MRLILACPFTVLSTLVLAPLISAQGVQVGQADYAAVDLGIAFGPGLAFEPASGSSVEFPFETAEFRIRVDGYEGGWVHPVLNIDVRDTEGLSNWMYFLDAGDSGTLSQIFWHGAASGTGVFDHVVDRKHTVQQMASLMTGGSGLPAPSEVLTWGQPILSPEFPTGGMERSGRVWRADSPLWTSSLGQSHRAAWHRLLADQSEVPTDATTFDTIATIRHGITAQSIYYDGTTTHAALFFASDGWTSVISTGAIAASIQAIALRAPEMSPEIHILDDDDAPDLAGQAGLVPFYGGSATAKIIIRYGELGYGFNELEAEPLLPNSRVYFTAMHAAAGFVLRFPRKGGGVVEFPAYPAPLEDEPGRYCVFLDATVDSGEVHARDDLNPTFEKVADVIVDHGTPQGAGQ